MLEQKPNNEQKDETQLPSSPNNSNTNVIGSQSPPMCLDDAISELSVRAKEGNMELWLNFIMKCLKNVEGFYEWFGQNHKSKEFSIVAKIGDGFYVDISQVRALLIKMRGYEIKDRREAI